MAERLTTRIKRAWNAFSRDPTVSDPYSLLDNYGSSQDLGYGSSYRNDRVRLSRGNERSIINSILNRISLDVAAVDIRHARLDAKTDAYKETIMDGLNNCLTLEANIDQTARAFIQDITLSMFDEGVIAIVPVDTSDNPIETGGYDIDTMRRGQITKWFPRHVEVNVYNDRTGYYQKIILPKSMVAIVENPMYSIMNEPNSTLQRLKRKLNLLDVVDEQSSSGKLDIIIQLPYTIKSTERQKQAEERRKQIEQQLVDSKYGIAYIDGTEHITQLNRAAENNLMKQVEYLTSMLYGQLGMTTAILDGTASEEEMTNYYDRTIEPIVSAITDEMKRKFLTKTARTQKQTIYFFRDPFRLIPASRMADMADKLTRNEIMTSNEIRQKLGMIPAEDSSADELRNKNINKAADQSPEMQKLDEEQKQLELLKQKVEIEKMKKDLGENVATEDIQNE